MNIEDIILNVILTALYGALFYFGIFRNTKVMNFQRAVSNTCYERQLEFINGTVMPKEVEGFRAWRLEMYTIDAIVRDIRSVSYTKMIFSSKPLEIENWYTEEQVKFLRGETHTPEEFKVKDNHVDMTTL